jgi:hypothetical protein
MKVPRRDKQSRSAPDQGEAKAGIRSAPSKAKTVRFSSHRFWYQHRVDQRGGVIVASISFRQRLRQLGQERTDP